MTAFDASNPLPSRRRLSRLLPLLLGAALLLPQAASAWWNKDFSQRTRITLNTSAAGIETREALSSVTVPVRLHSGNFDFLAARQDGADLRVIAGDDKTPLKFSVERFDGTNELAVLWVQVPVVAPGSDKNYIHVYAGNDKAAAEPPAAVFDAQTVAAFHFADRDGLAADAAAGALKSTTPLAVENNGLIGPSARLAGTALEWPGTERVRAAAGAPYAVSLWVKPEGAAGTLFAQGALTLALDAGKPTLRVGNASGAGGNLPPNAWAQLVVTLAGGKATLYINGAQASQFDAAAPEIAGGFKVGEGFTGLVDELQISTGPRSTEWLRFMHAAQGADAKLVASVKQTPEGSAAEGGGGQGGYFGILFANLTVDAWVVIVLCIVLFAIACWVMVIKFFMVRRTDAGNQSFLDAFRANTDVLRVAGSSQHPQSSLARLYDAGCRELVKRDVGKGTTVLSGASLDAVKAAVDADVVRESQRLNSHMVWLTIAISGGPFLGLLGTVVGVMITFAAIAAAGDVNVNAIAPGIAAALLATVAGLAVAIPALFGYNYLTSRMKNISADMQIFVDEFVTRVAEVYGAR
jgi:biopolymer transport protein ExbB